MMRSSCAGVLAACLLCLSEGSSQSADTIRVLRALALPYPPRYAETILTPNPVEARLATGSWRGPEAGEHVTFYGGKDSRWQEITAKPDGWFDDTLLNGCYVYARMHSDRQSVGILTAMGDEMVYVNGEPRSGNPYGMKDAWESWEPHFDYSLLPVTLRKGDNELLFRCSRGVLKVSAFPSAKPVVLNPRDVTTPDLLLGQPADAWAAIVVINASLRPLSRLSIIASVDDGKSTKTDLPVIQPMSVRKVPFRLVASREDSPGTARVRISLVSRNPVTTLDTTTLPLRVVGADQNHKETFLSNVDGSVQYYAVNPSRDTSAGNLQALFFSLHGAGVEALNQSASYLPKTWGYIVAPTNRRPYGFNWEEWGRLDALEVLDIVKKKFPVDEHRIYLTGHSMGGHGVWHIGSLYPGLFAALGPSAGWISFWTYRYRGLDIADTTAVRRMVRRATTPSETFLHIGNFHQLGVYILHGSDDDNVPVSEARSMADSLRKGEYDFVFHEEPGAGHWWDKSPEPGADCVDWPPMFDFFARHIRPDENQVRDIAFCTSNPGVSSRDYWLTVAAQERQLEMSSVRIRFDPGRRVFTGTTTNVTRLAIDLSILPAGDSLTVVLDSQQVKFLPQAHEEQAWFDRAGGRWEKSNPSSPAGKNPLRYGTFKEVFRNRVIFVFGTHGSPGENQWAFNKARYDAEKLWYQGNGSIDVVSDDMLNGMKREGRNVVLYGNRTTNSAWDGLLSASPVQVMKNYVTIGKKRFSGANLCCLFVRPLPHDPATSVAAVSGTGIDGMRVSNRMPYLTPGLGLPDCTLLSTDVLTRGDEGVLFCGFFGLDWSLANGDFISR